MRDCPNIRTRLAGIQKPIALEQATIGFEHRGKLTSDRLPQLLDLRESAFVEFIVRQTQVLNGLCNHFVVFLAKPSHVASPLLTSHKSSKSEEDGSRRARAARFLSVEFGKSPSMRAAPPQMLPCPVLLIQDQNREAICHECRCSYPGRLSELISGWDKVWLGYRELLGRPHPAKHFARAPAHALAYAHTMAAFQGHPVANRVAMHRML